MNGKLERELDKSLRKIIGSYKISFTAKEYEAENNEHDIVMDIFGISPDLKRENRQYWGRELGKCWERIVSKLCESTCSNYGSALRFGDDEPFDFSVDNKAIDTKYRIGSGDAGTLKKLREYGKLLRSKRYIPITLIVRTDNLPAAMTALKAGEWEIHIGADAFGYIRALTNFDLQAWLEAIKKEGGFKIKR